MEDIKTILITGANSGIGKESARQLAALPEIEKIILACRNPAKAQAARSDLEQQSGRKIFESLVLDTSDSESITAAVAGLDSVDALIMNAGGFGGEKPFEQSSKGATNMMVTNVLGHFVLAESLIKQDKLKKVAMFAGSEAARGIPRMGVKQPKLSESSEAEFTSVVDGTFFTKKDPMESYAYAKYLGSLWMAALARANPHLRIFSVSPGGTSGTGVLNDLPWAMRMLFKVVGLRIMPLIGLMHDLPSGAKRYVDTLSNESYGQGIFYGSKPKVLTGELVDQSSIFPDLANKAIQDNAYRALAKFA